MIKTKWTVIVLVGVLGLQLLMTYFSSDTFEGNEKITMEASEGEVWNNLMNVKELHHTRKELDTVIMVKKFPGGLKQWQEVYKEGSVEEFVHTNQVRGASLTFKTLSSTKGFTGAWTYTISQLDETKFDISINEISSCENFFSKWVYTMVGRNSIMLKHLETLKQQIEKNRSKR